MYPRSVLQKTPKNRTFAGMNFLWKHKYLFKKSLVLAMVSLFLWANYGVHYTSLHQHHEVEHSEKEQGKAANDCSVCLFQTLIYEPSVQTFFNLSEIKIQDVYSVPFYKASAFLSDAYSISFLRGPPIRF